MTEKLDKLKNDLQERGLVCSKDTPLAKYTTLKIGGNADLFTNITTSDDLIYAVQKAQEYQIPYTVLGWGSNVLISDKGIRGLVIKNSSKEITIDDSSHAIERETIKPEARLQTVDSENYYSFEDLDYDESGFPIVSVKVDSGVYLPYLINILIGKGITGLQWFAGIPGTVGGAVFNNIHGGSHFFSEYVESVDVLTQDGEVKELLKEQLDFGYDYSLFHTNKDTIITVKLLLRLGDKNRARETSIAWATRKRLQPSNSAGCCFQNLDQGTQTQLSLESNSWGYIIDKILNLKGYQVGNAKISEKHAAFIETQSGATAADVLAIFEKIHTDSKDKLGITPKAEIFFLGFADSEVEKYR